MSWQRKRVSRLLVLGLTLAPLCGCFVVSDLLNPDLVNALGGDTQAISRSEGVVIVAFNNATSHAVQFFAFMTPGRTDLDADRLSAGLYPTGARSFSTYVDARKVGNEVLECPVGQVMPGTLAPDYSIETLGAVVYEASDSGTETIDVEYAGVAAKLGTAFVCGDVIEIRLDAVAAEGDDVNYVLSIQVIPGQ